MCSPLSLSLFLSYCLSLSILLFAFLSYCVSLSHILCLSFLLFVSLSHFKYTSLSLSISICLYLSLNVLVSLSPSFSLARSFCRNTFCKSAELATFLQCEVESSWLTASTQNFKKSLSVSSQNHSMLQCCKVTRNQDIEWKFILFFQQLSRIAN